MKDTSVKKIKLNKHQQLRNKLNQYDKENNINSKNNKLDKGKRNTNSKVYCDTAQPGLCPLSKKLILCSTNSNNRGY